MHISNSYAGYLSGVAYVMRTDVIPRLLHMSITTPIIHMDDVYITGILCRQLGIQPGDSKVFSCGRDFDPCKLKQVVCAALFSNSQLYNIDILIAPEVFQVSF